jgi:rubredoxin
LEEWECTLCGYVYDSEVGDPEHGVKPGHLLRLYPKTEFAPFAEPLKIDSLRRNRTRKEGGI